jgi:hypothetical protein
VLTGTGTGTSTRRYALPPPTSKRCFDFDSFQVLLQEKKKQQQQHYVVHPKEETKLVQMIATTEDRGSRR